MGLLGTVVVVVLLGWWFMPNVPWPRFIERWPPPDNQWEPWRPAYQGVDYTRGHFYMPRLIKAHAIRVNLAAPGVGVMVMPPETGLVGKTSANYATGFLREYGLQVAVNADSFLPFAKWAGQKTDPTGIAISDGLFYSAPVADRKSTRLNSSH